jgi:N-acetylmuramoyl-L-alanine amidase
VIKKYSVTIDAGHGGRDKGAAFLGVKEKDINLAMALAVGMKLRKMNVAVYFTRLTDEFLSIQQRVEISEEQNTDMLVSFHRYGKGNTGVGVIIGDNNRTGTITHTSKGAVMRLPRPEYEEKLAEKIIAEFQRSWSNTTRERQVILEGRDTKLKNLGLFAQQKIQKPTFIIELGSIKQKDDEYIKSNFDDIATAAARGVYHALAENRWQIEHRLQKGTATGRVTHCQGVDGVRQ